MREKNRVVFFILLSLFVSQSLSAQDDDISEVDKLISPKSTGYVTGRIFDSVILREQKGVGASAVREGRTLGTNTTITDKGFNINIGVSPMFDHRIYLQGAVKASSDNGFVNVFSKDQYQNTLSTGGNLMFFLKRSSFSYKIEERQRLHQRLRTVRARDEARFTSPTTINDPITFVAEKKSLVDTFLKYYYLDSAFIQEVRDGVFAGKVLSKDQRKSLAKQLKNEEGIKILLPSKWNEMSGQEMDSWIRANLADDLSSFALITRIRNEDDIFQKKKMLSVYDSLQLHAPWSYKPILWISVNYLYNTTKRPLFDKSKATKGYLGEYVDGYTDLTLALNGLSTTSKAKLYFSGGLTYNNMRPFDKLDLKTFEYSTWENDGIDSFLHVVQSKVYDSIPPRPEALGVQLQGAAYSNVHNIGLDVTIKAKYANGYNPTYGGSIGIFFPIAMGTTTLLLMPQAQLQKLEQKGLNFIRDQVVFGFNLSASVPAFLFSRK